MFRQRQRETLSRTLTVGYDKSFFEEEPSLKKGKGKRKGKSKGKAKYTEDPEVVSQRLAGVRLWLHEKLSIKEESDEQIPSAKPTAASKLKSSKSQEPTNIKVKGKVGNKDLEEFQIKAIQGRKQRNEDPKVQFSQRSK